MSLHPSQVIPLQIVKKMSASTVFLKNMLCTCLMKTKCLQQSIKLLTSSNIILHSNSKVKLNKKLTLKYCITFLFLLVFSLLAEIGRHSSYKDRTPLMFGFNLEVKFLLGLQPKNCRVDTTKFKDRISRWDYRPVFTSRTHTKPILSTWDASTQSHACS